MIKMSSTAENLPLTKEEIEKEALILQEQLLPVSDPNDPTLRPMDEVFAEVYEKVFGKTRAGVKEDAEI